SAGLVTAKDYAGSFPVLPKAPAAVNVGAWQSNPLAVWDARLVGAGHAELPDATTGIFTLHADYFEGELLPDSVTSILSDYGKPVFICVPLDDGKTFEVPEVDAASITGTQVADLEFSIQTHGYSGTVVNILDFGANSPLWT